MQNALKNAPVDLNAWIKANGSTLGQPLGSRQFWKTGWQNLLVMMIEGPNFPPGYHDDPGEELFIQLRGDVTLKLFDPVTRERSEVTVREGQMYLLPSHVRHCPQRPEGCIGLVIERYRQPGEVDALEWYDAAGSLEFRGEFVVDNIEENLVEVQTAWKNWSQTPDRRIPTIWRAPIQAIAPG
jgi:3-hydroxyanthranilate 3,4-dioxygenase